MNHKEMDVWKCSLTLVEQIYGLTNTFPRHEQYGLVSQIRRAAVSIPSNISEGAGRRSRRDFARFVDIVLGSIAELETQLIVAGRLGYCDHECVMPELIRVRAMALGLRKHLIQRK